MGGGDRLAARGVEVFEQLFTRIVRQCVEEGLVAGAKIHMDASVVDANASKDSVVQGSEAFVMRIREAVRSEVRKLDEEQELARGRKYHTTVNDKALSLTDPDAALVRKDFGFMVEWDTAEMPYLTQWKNTRQGIYVSGIEPGNCLPEGQLAARRNKRLVIIQPGEARSFSCVLSVLPTARAVQAAKNRIRTLRETGIPAKGCQLKDYAKQK